MTAATLPSGTPAPPVAGFAPTKSSWTRRARFAATDALILAKRDVLVWRRNPSFLVFVVVQPIMFVLLFRYVFGGAIKTGTPGGYVAFLTPGILGQSAAFGSFGTAIALAREIQRGVIDRFRSMPMARSAVLLGRLTADTLRMTFTVLMLLGVSALVGFRFYNGFWPAVAMVIMGIIFGLVVCTVSAYIGIAIKDEESVGSFGLIWLFPLTFVSSAFVPVQSMPGWLQAFAKNQPVSVVINEMRNLALGGPLVHGAWLSAVWMLAVLVVFIPLAVRSYRKA